MQGDALRGEQSAKCLYCGTFLCRFGGLVTVRVLFYLLFVVRLLAQSGPVVMGGGYRDPVKFRVAPGQVITVYVTAKTILPDPGGGSRIRGIRADSLPLPKSIAGFSARVKQSDQPDPFPAPLISVEQEPTCTNSEAVFLPPAAPECWTTAITLQIPYEMTPKPSPKPVPVLTQLIISEGKNDSIALPVGPYDDVIHVLGCSTWSQVNSDPCPPVVTHADGTLVSPPSPANPGEVVVVYGYGFGRTVSLPATGEAAPTPALPLSRQLRVQFDFRVNAGPSRPVRKSSTQTTDSVLFAGLTPGQAGLYQVNIKLPDEFPSVEPCGSDVDSNATITISGTDSFDGAPICVQAGP